MDAGASLITLSFDGRTGYDLSPVADWLAWRDETNGNPHRWIRALEEAIGSFKGQFVTASDVPWFDSAGANYQAAINQVENAYEETAMIEAIPPERVVERLHQFHVADRGTVPGRRFLGSRPPDARILHALHWNATLERHMLSLVSGEFVMVPVAEGHSIYRTHSDLRNCTRSAFCCEPRLRFLTRL